MAKAKPKIIDQGTAMERILGFKKPEVGQPSASQAEHIAESPPEPLDSSFPEPKTELPATTPRKGRALKKEKYVQTAFYITPAQRMALKMRAARSDNPNEKDLSAIVRTAIDAYLGL